jgi:hypothetical protein
MNQNLSPNPGREVNHAVPPSLTDLISHLVLTDNGVYRQPYWVLSVRTAHSRGVFTVFSESPLQPGRLLSGRVGQVTRPGHSVERIIMMFPFIFKTMKGLTLYDNFFRLTMQMLEKNFYLLKGFPHVF